MSPFASPSRSCLATLAKAVQEGKKGPKIRCFQPVTGVTASGAARPYHSFMPGGGLAAGREEEKMTRIARKAWRQAQTTAIVFLCAAACMALPVTLAAIGFHTL